MAYVSQDLKKELTPGIKAVLKKYGVKASLSVRNKSTLVLTIQESHFDVMAQVVESHECYKENGAPSNYSYNPYHFRNMFKGELVEFLTEVHEAMNVGNFDKSDTMTDYFHVGWYTDVCFGKWDKPYILTPKPDSTPPKTPTKAVVSGKVEIEEHTHTKKGFQIFICIMPERVSKEEFSAFLTVARRSGGWYSRKWGTTPAGFAFKNREVAEAFAGGTDETSPEPKETPCTPHKPDTHKAEKLRSMAESMQPAIENKLSDRLTNTPKRMREAGKARLNGNHMKRAQTLLFKLADCHEAANVPGELQLVSNKKTALELTKTKVLHSGGYYDCGVCTGKPYQETPESLAAFALIGRRSSDELKAEQLRKDIIALQFTDIAGYFPTPKSIVEKMIELADLPEGRFKVLEPSAGSGNIADAIKEISSAAEIDVFEINPTLNSILKRKGYNVSGYNFKEEAGCYDRILMNPPFEKGQDAEHVMIAHKRLSENGKLIAIMSPGPFFRSDKRSEEFRKWFYENGGKKTDLPANSFKPSGTNVSTVMVSISK